MTREIKKLANAWYKSAEVDSWIASASPFWFFEFFLMARLTELFRRLSGGVWVGGSVILSDTDLQFVPNAMNWALHEEDSIPPVQIALSQINRARNRFGIVTGIVDVTYSGGRTFTFRCFNAKGLAVEISRRSRTDLA